MKRGSIVALAAFAPGPAAASAQLSPAEQGIVASVERAATRAALLIHRLTTQQPVM
jgi:hypothetical protein